MRTDPVYAPEAMLVAAILVQPAQYTKVRWVREDWFDNPVNRQVWVAVDWLLDREDITDPDMLLTRVRALLAEYHKTEALQRLVALTGNYPVVGEQAEHYATAVMEARKHHDLVALAAKVSQIATSDRVLGEKVELIDAAWVEAMAEAHIEPGWRPIDGLSTVTAFIEATDTTHEWVLPGMLERQERFMLIAPEKAGKTVLTRQVALLLAAGRHPFNHDMDVPVMRTLIVDLENPAAVARRDFRRQIAQMDDLWQTENENAYVLHKPAGMHLGDGTDRAILRSAVDRLDIDLLCISPIYKAYDGLDRSWEEQAYGVQKPLDRLREEFNCALWLEHHAPWGEYNRREYRALGSSRWARWLDYQVSLVPQGQPPHNELQWRAVRRDERKMAPRAIRRGGYGQPSWLPVWDDNLDGHGFDLAMHEAET